MRRKPFGNANVEA
jgi:vacuolar protein sorting-associated protein 29